jgi:hypothetical protein
MARIRKASAHRRLRLQDLGTRLGRRRPGRHTENVQELLTQQRPDAGWGQIPTLASDAYATGQALTAIRTSNVITPSDANFMRGIRFLLNFPE